VEVTVEVSFTIPNWDEVESNWDEAESIRALLDKFEQRCDREL
jgi:hypothetical protein